MASILEQTYSTAAKGVADYNFKLVEMARTNSNAVFQFACGLGGMKSLAEMVALSTEQARKQFDLVTAQNKEAPGNRRADGEQVPPSRSSGASPRHSTGWRDLKGEPGVV